ncbi:LCP family protein [Anaerocolumna sp. AGMB13025]|uniref:LCP family protein n=1 Tax=Anaerocolumna sp. AGMB13025 TaxID=3039116 RepID=UPI00241DF13F|nr:LCP family protein [Anaerocolumna sp. AGMB13025]WFR55863.1 LCP family protein [Anaerocolumna sp. AGMB13025]
MSNRYEEDLLKQQVLEIMNAEKAEKITTEPEKRKGQAPQTKKSPSRKKKKPHKALKIAGSIALFLLILIVLIIGTKPGRSIIYKSVSTFAFQNMNNEDIIKEYDAKGGAKHADGARHEDYVTNYLIFGIEEFGGARNTDSMMIASINTKDDTLKLTSLLRDSYVDIKGYKANKLNSAYARGGARLLVDTIEKNYKVQIDGYVSVDFKSFEKIVDLLGGVTIELGKEEAQYLNKTNYISQKKNRNVKKGVNHLNGNQVMGYVRVRKVKTLGGVNNDYGRIVRQQRALKAMFESYKSPKNLFKIISVTKESLGYVTTNLTQDQIEKAMEDVVENKITTLDTFRVPVDGAFDAPKKYNGITYPIVLDWDKNRVELYKFIFDDTEKEAVAALK